MRILYITPIYPWPLHGGPPIRIYNMLRGLADAGHDITLISGIEPDQGSEAHEINTLVAELHTYRVRQTNPWLVRLNSILSRHPYPAQRFVTQELRDLVASHLEEDSYDLVVVNFLYMVDALPRSAAKQLPVVLDQHESEEMLWKGVAQNGSLLERIFAMVMVSKIPSERQRALEVTDAVLSVSPLEAQDLETRLDGELPIYVVPNGVNLSTFAPDNGLNDSQKIIFVAGMGVRRNVDAAAWFAEEVFPQIQEKCSEAELVLVGANPTPRAKGLGQKAGVTVTGTVPDVRPYYQQARCVVLPYRFGAGIKLKLLEAMALQRPIITTSKGCHGVDLVDGEHVLIRDDPEGLAQAGIHVLDDDALARTLAKNARKVVEEYFAWEEINAELDRTLREIVDTWEANRS